MSVVPLYPQENDVNVFLQSTVLLPYTFVYCNILCRLALLKSLNCSTLATRHDLRHVSFLVTSDMSYVATNMGFRAQNASS